MAKETGKVRRSRYGCRNCKLRKLKCDEAKPQCRRCKTFGVVCNFLSNVSDLMPITSDIGAAGATRQKAEIQPLLTSAVWTADEASSYQLNARCRDFMTRYFERNLSTPDDPNVIKANSKLKELAFSYPFLMHSTLAISLTYDRYLNDPLSCSRTLEECFHWSQSTTLFNKRLQEPIAAADRDAIWGTAAALALLSFSSPVAITPQQSWPLATRNSPDSAGLDWLRMYNSKMALWHLVNPLRHDSLFIVMASTYAFIFAPKPESGIDGVPQDLAAVCHLEEWSTKEDNAYFEAAHAISQILDLPDSQVKTGQALVFMGSMHGPFRDMLERKDPVALLLLYIWYEKVSRCIWWVALRARIECPSISAYLKIYHKDNEQIQAFLPADDVAV